MPAVETGQVQSVESPSEVAKPPSRDDAVRYHHLDAVRGFALLLGVFFHAAESFGPHNSYWAIVDCSPSDFLEWFRFACHSFRLELFFVIAGFFARLLVVRRGPGNFVRNRLSRILVPLVVGWVLLYPVLVAIWLWGASVSGHLADMVPPEAMNFKIWQLVLGFFVTGEFVRRFDLTHLWFLHQLLVLYAVMLAVRWSGLWLDRQGRIMVWFDRWFARVVACRGALLGFALPCIPLLLMMRSWTVDTPKESLIPHVPTTLLFGFCFLAGWLWHRQPNLLEPIARRWPWHLGLGVLVWIGFGCLHDPQVLRRLAPEQVPWARLAYLALYAQMMWAFAFGFLGLFTRFCQKASSWTRYVADASYWIYVVHLPLIVALQVLLGRVALPWPVKYLFICGVAFPLVFVSYHYLVRGTIIGVQLNGRRYPVRWPWRDPAAG